MRTLSTILFALTILPIGIAAAEDAPLRADAAQAKAAGLDVETLQSLDDAMQKQVDESHVSGVIGLIARHGKVGYRGAFGKRVIEDGKPMTKETLFRIYSMTKPIVAVTAMSLWEEGKFKLDDPISAHLPEWKDATVKQGDEVVAATPVTPRHLMTHSSGLSYNRQGLKLDDEATLEEFSRSVAARPLEFQPGTNYRYGYSIDILGRYIEAIEGKSLDAVMRERVLDRLGMNDTEFWVRTADDRGRVAFVYTKSKEGELKPLMTAEAVMKKPSRMMGGQGLMLTIDDYHRFCQMLANKGELDGRRVLKAETVELMCQNHLKKIDKVYGLGGTVDGKGGYRCGEARAGTKFWVDTADNNCGVFMIQRWDYNPPTWDIFESHAKRAIHADDAAEN